jgi:hypothetical protein
MNGRVCICVYLCVSVCICVYLCVSVCICVYQKKILVLGQDRCYTISFLHVVVRVQYLIIMYYSVYYSTLVSTVL